MLLSEKNLKDYEISARDGTVGNVTDLYFDDQQWIVRYVIVDTGSWLNSRKVLLPVARLREVTVDQQLVVDSTREQIRNSPPVDWDQPVSRTEERNLHDYFGWPYYWQTTPTGSLGLVTPMIAPPPPPAELATAHPARAATAVADEHPLDPHLRSADEVRGYHIEARTGSAGHVEDFLVDTAGWNVRYLVVDTRNWWPGKKVLVAPAWIEGVSWPKETVAIDLTLDQIRHSPPYDADRPVDSVYAARLHDYYGKPRYDL